MTVVDLIRELEKYDPELRVYSYDRLEIQEVCEEDELEMRNNDPPLHRSRSLRPTRRRIIKLW